MTEILSRSLSGRVWSIFYRSMAISTPLALVMILVGAELLQDFPSASTRLVGVALASVGAILYSCSLGAAFRASPYRGRARLCIFVTLISAGTGLFISERLFPLPAPAIDRIQSNLRRLVGRRNQEKTSTFRGFTESLVTNDFGFPDTNHSYRRTDCKRILFIGDSFLESRSRRNLPQRVAEIMNCTTPTETINLSLSDSGPDEYRLRLREFALQYRPDLIVVCLYEANDLEIGFHYEPYHPRRFFVSKEAVRFAMMEKFSDSIIESLRKSQASGKILDSRASFLQTIPQDHLTPEKADLLYLFCLATSTDPDHSQPLLYNTFQRIKLLLQPVLPARSSGGLSSAATSRAARALYEKPRQERLRLLSELIGRDYFCLPDGKPIEELLRDQGPKFLNDFTEVWDQWFYLLTALRCALVNKGIANDRIHSLKPFQATSVDVEAGIQQNLLMLRDMVQVARENGTNLTFVFIPEASQIDGEFQAFWRGLSDFKEGFGGIHKLYLGLTAKISETTPIVDLSQYKEGFDGGYWLFDGHWSEKGNATAAEVVAKFVLDHFQPSGTLRPIKFSSSAKRLGN